MKKPEPEIGQIIRFDYLWRDEQLKGWDEGSKDRPCAVVVASQKNDHGEVNVLLAPITHSAPKQGQVAVEIPSQAKRATGLDEDRSWLILSEINMVQWSDAGIVPAKKGRWLYGLLPRGVTIKAAAMVVDGLTRGSAKVVDRTGKLQLFRNRQDNNNDRGR